MRLIETYRFMSINEKFVSDFRAALRKAIPGIYKSIAKKHRDLCSFGICTTPIVEALSPVFQCTSFLPDSDPDGYEKYWPGEWEFGEGKTGFGAKVLKLRDRFKEAHDAAEESDEVADTYLESILEVMVELKDDGVFDKNVFLTLWLVGGDEDDVLTASKRLNSRKVHKAATEALG